ncbi:hypothetical protein ACVW00_003920 [Marmoricola sp. URHA0025 HA25]
MSIDERLRAGLAANTEHLDTRLDRELSLVLRRAHRRRQTRVIAGVGLLAAAVVAAVAWLGGVPGLVRADQPPDPARTPKVTVLHPRSMAGIDGPIEAGTWVVPFWGNAPDSLPRAVVEVPEGYGSPGGWVVDRGADGDPDQYGSVSFWTVHRVFRDPCEGVTSFDPGPGTAALARALRSQTGFTATSPRPVEVDGYAGLYLEVSFPTDSARVVGCRGSQYLLWSTDAGDSYGTDRAGTVSRLWILDVLGTRVVMVADTTPREDAAATAEVLGIAASAHFLEPLDQAR